MIALQATAALARFVSLVEALGYWVHLEQRDDGFVVRVKSRRVVETVGKAA